MARVPRALARELDRLSRRAHRFHRYAHHPLCAAYTQELVRLGRRGRVCRGCALLLAGGATGALCAWLVPLRAGSAPTACAAALVLSLAGAALAGADFGRPGLPPQPRASKWLTRALPGFALLLACGVGVRACGLFGSALLLAHAAAAALAYVLYRRRGPNRAPCAVCPERASPAPCSGYARIVQRERAFARAARRMLVRVG
jgi:hypothetical protein